MLAQKAAGMKPYGLLMTCPACVMYIRMYLKNNYCTYITNFTGKNNCERKFGALQCACTVQLHSLAYEHGLSCIIF